MAAHVKQVSSLLFPNVLRRIQWISRPSVAVVSLGREDRRGVCSSVEYCRLVEQHGASARLEWWPRVDTDQPWRTTRVCGGQDDGFSGQGGGGAESGHTAAAAPTRYVLPPSLLALSLFGRKEAKKVDELEMLLKQARLAEHHRDWKKADDSYHEALELLNRRKMTKFWDDAKVLDAQVYIYDNMANLSLVRGKFKEAENLYKETIKGLLQANKAADCNAIVEISLKLAMIYAMQQRTQDAEEGYKYCIKMQQDKLLEKKEVDDDSLALLGMCVNSYSRFLILHKRMKEAQASLNQAIKVAVKVFGNDHPQIAVLYSDLATVDTFQENYDAAKEHINKAIEVGTRAKSPDVCTFVCNLGLICLERNECSQAEDCCRRALKMAKEEKNLETEAEAERCLREIKEKQAEKEKKK